MDLPRLRHRALALAIASAALCLHTGTAAAHTGLRGASPGAGDHLSVAPRELRLTFSDAVEPAVARLALVGPAGPVALAALGRHPDSAAVLLGPILGPLVAGEYTVRWQIAGPDGHPVRGDYSFVLAPGAQGLANPGAAPPAPSDLTASPQHEAVTFPEGPGFDAGSPLYAAVRWITFVGLLGVVGAVAFRLLVLSRLTGRGHVWGPAPTRAAARGAAGTGLVAVSLLATAVALRLLAQSYALHGSAGAMDPALLGTMLARTTWGTAWMLQAGATVAAAAGLLLARGGARAGWGIAALAALVLCLTPALSGHAAATPRLAPLAITADALHVLGAGGWLGTLLVVLAVGIPATRKSEGDRAGAVAALIHAFSPIALAFATLVVATGTLTGWMHLGTATALWQSGYGRTLLLKLALVALLFAIGAFNWRRVRPALGSDAATARLQRSSTLELAVGAAVLAVTAALVATHTP